MHCIGNCDLPRPLYISSQVLFYSPAFPVALRQMLCAPTIGHHTTFTQVRQNAKAAQSPAAAALAPHSDADMEVVPSVSSAGGPSLQMPCLSYSKIDFFLAPGAAEGKGGAEPSSGRAGTPQRCRHGGGPLRSACGGALLVLRGQASKGVERHRPQLSAAVMQRGAAH